MRVNNFFAFKQWFSVAKAMGPMLDVLSRYPEKGLLSRESFYRFFPLEAVFITYWKSFEHLENFARNPHDPHLEAWRELNLKFSNNDSVGFWHETYIIQAGQCEAIYGNMPIFGLASATKHVPIVKKNETARRRLGGENEPAIPLPQINK